jgi:hypothetical protein
MYGSSTTTKAALLVAYFSMLCYILQTYSNKSHKTDKIVTAD